MHCIIRTGAVEQVGVPEENSFAIDYHILNSLSRWSPQVFTVSQTPVSALITERQFP
ncbi:MAG: hypothetical protein HUU01_21905 [Saprospiraceae bacterium]|nr:hypothetical protein [Saprospiraceae bacterium]